MPKQVQTLQQKQSLIMTTTMHQSISILQMSNLELSEFAAQELDKNPFIEDDSISVEKEAENKKLEIRESQNNSASSSNYSSQDFLANIASEKSLNEHIVEQINIKFDNPKDQLIAMFLLDSLSSSGYLNITVSEAAKILKCDEDIVNRILKVMQKFDPPGIFARDLQECLLLQVSEDRTDISLIVKVIENIHLVAEGSFAKLARMCKTDVEHITECIKQIKLLNPKPANGFFVEPTKYKIPDVILSFSSNGTAKIEPNFESMPRLRVNQEYYHEIKDNMQDSKEKAFAKSEIDAANVIVKGISQRSHTILKVASAIVEEQIDFFKRGVMYLKPLTLNKIAVSTGFNESTVSRSTANKYISTPSGIFELKYFFSSSLGAKRASAEDVSSTKVKEIIKQIVLSEDDDILSDDDISQQLSYFNISIARRTVAKYRESIGIPTSSVRKRNRKMAR